MMSRPTHITCVVCDKVDVVNPGGTISTRCGECRIARHRYRQRQCDKCEVTYWPLRRNSTLCETCRASRRDWVRPTHVTCVSCMATIQVDPRGKIRKWCPDCRPKVRRLPLAMCETCGKTCRPSRKRLFVHCDTCVKVGRARKDTSLRRRYGITLTQYEELWKRQRGLCGVCSRDLNQVCTVCTDHDHRTGKVRGLLCHHCNRALGTFGDGRDGVLLALTYLENPPASFIHKGVDTLTCVGETDKGI